MPNLFQRSATWLGGKLQTAAGRAVTYRQGSRYVSLTGVPYEQTGQVVDETGMLTTLTWMEWTLVADELVLNSEAVNPRSGDRITETLNGDANTWEVLPVAGKKEWDWCDTSGLLIKVRTKRVE